MREEKVLQILPNGIITESGFKSVATNAGFGIGSSVFTQDGCVIGWDFSTEQRSTPTEILKGFFFGGNLALVRLDSDFNFKIEGETKNQSIINQINALTNLFGFGRCGKYFYCLFSVISDVDSSHKKEIVDFRIYKSATDIISVKLFERTYTWVSSDTQSDFAFNVNIADFKNKIIEFNMTRTYRYRYGNSAYTHWEVRVLLYLTMNLENGQFSITEISSNQTQIGDFSAPAPIQYNLPNGFVIRKSNAIEFYIGGNLVKSEAQTSINQERFNSKKIGNKIVIFKFNLANPMIYIFSEAGGFISSRSITYDELNGNMLSNLIDTNDQSFVKQSL